MGGGCELKEGRGLVQGMGTQERGRGLTERVGVLVRRVRVREDDHGCRGQSDTASYQQMLVAS